MPSVKKRLLLIGGGGHCRSVLDSLLPLRAYDEIGIVDRACSSASEVAGIRVVGTDDALPLLHQNGWTDAFITLGSIGNTSKRRELFELLEAIGYNMPSIIDKSAVIARDAILGQGTFVGKRAVINANARLGVCSIINTGAIVEHDCVVGAFAHISPGAILCGNVTVECDAHVGAGAVVRQQIKIGRGALIGIGSVVVRDIPDNVKAYGNPCKVVET